VIEAERQAALLTGKVHYWTGKPCAKGHIAKRYTKSRTCVACMSNDYRKQDPDHYRTQSRKNYAKYREYHLARGVVNHRRAKLERPWSFLVSGAKTRAKLKNIAFTIDNDWAKNVWTGRCSLTGIPFELDHGSVHGHPFSPSIDRIDNIQGYTPENCRFVLHAVNCFKLSMSDEQLITIARALVNKADGG
jgi:hypothetical protein